MSTNAKWRLLVLALSTLLPASVWTQSFTGSISGTIKDPSGAVVPNIEVTLKSITTSVETKFTTGSDGLYHFRSLPQDTYELRASAQGFRNFVQTGITVSTNQAVTLDVTLQVGLELQTIEVQANASPLNFENAEIKQAIPERAVGDLPLQVAGNPRAAATFALLLPGVTSGGGGDPFNARVNGGQQLSDEALLDGVSMQQGVSSVAGMVAVFGDAPIIPEEVSEVSVLTSNYEPHYGSTSSSVITLVTKSGTDGFHGEAHEFHRNTVLNARQFGVDTRPQNIENEFGASIGGPVKIPGLTGGPRKTFFYTTYDRWVPRGGTVRPVFSFPTVQQREGDFRDWVDGSGNLIPIYDPATTRPNPAFDPSLSVSSNNEPFLRDQFMGCDGQTPNVICPSRIQNSLAKQWFQFLPTPNLPGTSNNYVAQAVPAAAAGGSGIDHRTTWALRLDHYLSEKDHFSLNLHYHLVVQGPSTALPPEVSPVRVSSGGGSQGPWANRLNWDHTFNPTTVNNFNFGYKNERGAEVCLDRPFAGVLPQIPGVASHVDPPVLTFEDFSQIGCNGAYPDASRPAYIVNDLLTWVRGKHTLKFGGEYRALQQNEVEVTNPSGEFYFSRLNTGLLGGTSGSAIASFLLEGADSASATYQANTTEQNRAKYYTFHAGDTWKVTPKFTLNFGLRWDLSTPAVDKFNRSSFLDPLGANPGAGGRPGRLAFAGTEYGAASFGRDHPELTWRQAFAPRLGIAYRVNDKTVVRTGYGIFYSQAPYPGWNAGNRQDGFNLNVAFSSSLGGLTPALSLRQGIPQNFTPPPFIDSTYLNGQSGPIYRPFDANRLPYSQQWNLTIERELTNDFYFSAAYVGNKGTRLPSATAAINALDPRLLGLGAALFDEFQPGQTELNGVPIPYPGWNEQMTGCPPSVAQALVPFPQYCGTLQGTNENAGNSTYHSFQFKAEKRISQGTWFLASYTLSKLITDSESIHTPVFGGTISPFERHRNKALSIDDVPQMLSLAFLYELPFGKGKRFLNQGGVVDKLLGGWQVSSIFRAAAGIPFTFGSGQCTVPSQFAAGCIPAVLPGADPFLQDPGSFDPGKGPLFSNGAFESPSSFNFYLGQGPRVSNLRAQGFHNHDVTLMKNTYIGERVGIQFRAEFFNIWNWHIFSTAFDTDVSSPNFGTWNGGVTPPRNIQFALKVLF